MNQRGGDSRAYKEDKTQRPYVGVVTVCNGQKYCIPLTSNKEKFSKMTGKIDISLIVIQGKIKGAVEFSRMIPVEDGQLKNLIWIFASTINHFEERQYRKE